MTFRRIGQLVLTASAGVMLVGYMTAADAMEPSQDTINATMSVRISQLEKRQDDASARLEKMSDQQTYGLVGIFGNLIASGLISADKWRKKRADDV